MKILETKYALTNGIIERDVEDCGGGMVKVLGTIQYYLHGEGRDCHRTREGAVARAEKMRKDKIARLRKQIERLEKLRFE